MKFYELTCLISQNTPEEEIKTLSQRIKDEINKEGEVLESGKGATLKTLNHSAKKNNQAFLVDFVFKFNPSSLEKLEKMLKSENQIIRFMMLVKEDPGKAKKSFFRRRPPLHFKEKIEKEGETKTAESPKVNLKDIDKQIEEILKKYKDEFE